MILQAICQLTFSIILNLRFGYFCMKNCVFKKGALSYARWILKNSLSFFLPTWLAFRFHQWVEKNWWIDVITCSMDQCKPIVECCVNHVITTFKELALRYPTIWLDDKSCLHLLFISTRPKWKRSDGICFITSPFGHNQLRLIIDNMIFHFPWKRKFCQTKLENGLKLGLWKKLSFHESTTWRLWVIKTQSHIWEDNSLLFLFLFFTFSFGFKFLFFFWYVHLFLVF
jgi:hypothetical protein